MTVARLLFAALVLVCIFLAWTLWFCFFVTFAAVIGTATLCNVAARAVGLKVS